MVRITYLYNTDIKYILLGFNTHWLKLYLTLQQKRIHMEKEAIHHVTEDWPGSFSYQYIPYFSISDLSSKNWNISYIKD